MINPALPHVEYAADDQPALTRISQGTKGTKVFTDIPSSNDHWFSEVDVIYGDSLNR